MSAISMFSSATLAFLVAATATVSLASASPGVPALETAVVSSTMNGYGANGSNRVVLAASDRCMPSVKAYGKASGYAPDILKRQLAKVRAVSEWRDKVEAKHGHAYKTWRRAEDRDVHCDTSLGAQHCIAEGRPCGGTAHGSIF